MIEGQLNFVPKGYSPPPPPKGPDRIGIIWRVALSIIVMGMCLLMYACAYGAWWVFAIGVITPFVLLCTGTVWRIVMALYEGLRALFQAPETPEYQHTVDGVREAALRVHNWASRNVAAAIGIGSLALVTLTGPGLIKFLLCSVAIVIATHWPAIMTRFRDWNKKLEAAE